MNHMKIKYFRQISKKENYELNLIKKEKNVIFILDLIKGNGDSTIYL